MHPVRSLLPSRVLALLRMTTAGRRRPPDRGDRRQRVALPVGDRGGRPRRKVAARPLAVLGAEARLDVAEAGLVVPDTAAEEHDAADRPGRTLGEPCGQVAEAGRLAADEDPPAGVPCDGRPSVEMFGCRASTACSAATEVAVSDTPPNAATSAPSDAFLFGSVSTDSRTMTRWAGGGSPTRSLSAARTSGRCASPSNAVSGPGSCGVWQGVVRPPPARSACLLPSMVSVKLPRMPSGRRLWDRWNVRTA